MLLHLGCRTSLSNLLFLVEYIQWLKVMVQSSFLQAGGVQNLLAKDTVQAQKEGVREKAMVQRPRRQELVGCWSLQSQSQGVWPLMVDISVFRQVPGTMN